MRNYKIFFTLFLSLFLVSSLFADKTKQNSKKEDNNIAYLGLQKQVSRLYKVTGNFKKDNKYNKKNVAFESYVLYKQDDNKEQVNISTDTYNILGTENGFDVLAMDPDTIYNIDGTEISYYHKRLTFTDYQKAQIKYLEMERQSKILALDREINSKKKLLDEELSGGFTDVFLIDELSKEIKSLAVDKETVNINVDKKIRYILAPEQYLKYKEKQNKKNKKK